PRSRPGLRMTPIAATSRERRPGHGEHAVSHRFPSQALPIGQSVAWVQNCAAWSLRQSWPSGVCVSQCGKRHPTFMQSRSDAQTYTQVPFGKHTKLVCWSAQAAPVTSMRPKPATIANAPSVAEQRRLWRSDAVSADMLYGRGLDTLELLGDRHLGVTATTRWRASSVPARRCVRATTERTNPGKSPRSG